MRIVMLATVVIGVLAPYQPAWSLFGVHQPSSPVGPGLAAAPLPLEVKSSLAGTVLADHLVKAGDEVEDAQPLVYVRTALTGAVSVAARAPRPGVVSEVLVRPGLRIERGDIVVRLTPK